MILSCLIMGIFFTEILINNYNDYKKGTKIDLAWTLFLAVVSILGAICISGTVSMIAPAFAPTTDYDYSFKIYSVGDTEHFYLDENNGYYTYMRKMSNGTKMESIPIDKTYIVYSDDVKPEVQVDAVKHGDTSKWEKCSFLFFSNEDQSSIYVKKYTMILPTDAIVR